MAESRIRSGKQTEIRGDISNETNVKHVRKNKDSRRQVSIPSYTGLGLMVHLLLLIIYIAVHIHGAIILKNCPNPEKYFRGYSTFGGPWKYLTYINQWLGTIYFLLSLFGDIIPQSQIKTRLKTFLDWFFTTTVWSVALIVMIFFWGMYFINRELIFPVYLDEFISPLLNHGWHTLPLFAVVIECVLVFHHYPSNMVAALTALGTSSFYMIWILVIYLKTKEWIYPFMKSFTPITFVIFVIFSTFAGLLFQALGKFIAYLRWKEQFLILHEMKNK